MELGTTKKEEYYTYETDFSQKEAQVFINYALKNIVNDQEALINWAVVDILKKQIENKEEYNRFLKKIAKSEEKKNTKKENNKDG